MEAGASSLASAVPGRGRCPARGRGGEPARGRAGRPAGRRGTRGHRAARSNRADPSWAARGGERARGAGSVGCRLRRHRCPDAGRHGRPVAAGAIPEPPGCHGPARRPRPCRAVALDRRRVSGPRARTGRLLRPCACALPSPCACALPSPCASALSSPCACAATDPRARQSESHREVRAAVSTTVRRHAVRRAFATSECESAHGGRSHLRRRASPRTARHERLAVPPGPPARRALSRAQRRAARPSCTDHAPTDPGTTTRWSAAPAA
jgi:hypothetical protein